jgi:hypothetical protein
MKHVVELRIFVPTQDLLWEQGKPRKTLIEFRGAPCEQISIRHEEGYIKLTFLMLPLGGGGLHVKHSV